MTPFLRRAFLFALCLTAITGYAFAQTPTVSPDTYTTQQDTPLVIPAGTGVLTNDTGYDPATHRLESYDPLSQYGGVVSVAADGSFTYTPKPGFIGLDTFSYTVRNSFGASATLVSITVTPPPGVANDDGYTLTPHLTFISPTSVTANDVDVTSITGFGDSLATANGTPVNGSNFITAGGAGGRVVLNPDGTFTYYPDSGDVDTTARFFYTINDFHTAEVTLTLTNQEQVWVVDGTPSGAVCTGDNDGTPACPFANFGGAWAGTSTANDVILVDSGAYTCGVTLLDGQRMLGAGTSDAVEASTGITPQPGSTYAPYGTFSGTRPTLSIGVAANCITLAQNNTIRGLNIGSTPSAQYALSGSNFGTLITSQVSISGTGGVMSLNTGTLAATFDSLETTNSANRAISLSTVGGTLTVTGTTTLDTIADTGIYILNSLVAATFASLNINNVTVIGAEGIWLHNNTDPAFSFTANGGTIQNTNGHNIFILNSGNVSFSDMTFDTPAAPFNNISEENGRGINSLTRVTLNGTRSNGFYTQTQSSLFSSNTWTLTDVNCTTSGVGLNEFCIAALVGGTHSLNLNLIGTALGESIMRARNDAVNIRADGAGAQIRFNMDRVRLSDPTGTTSRRGGLIISAQNAGSIDYVVQRSEFLNLYPDALNQGIVRLATSGTMTGGNLRGRFSNNTITSVSSESNRAIWLTVQRTQTFEADISNNTVNINGTATVIDVSLAFSISDARVRIAHNVFNQNTTAASLSARAMNINTSSFAPPSGNVRFQINNNQFTTGSTAPAAPAVSVIHEGGVAGLYTTFTNNTFNSGNTNDFTASQTSSTGISCLAFTGNGGTAPATASVSRSAGTFQVANLASLATNNPDMSVTTTGTFSSTISCPNVAFTGAIPAFPNLLP